MKHVKLCLEFDHYTKLDLTRGYDFVQKIWRGLLILWKFGLFVPREIDLLSLTGLTSGASLMLALLLI